MSFLPMVYVILEIMKLHFFHHIVIIAVMVKCL